MLESVCNDHRNCRARVLDLPDRDAAHRGRAPAAVPESAFGRDPIADICASRSRGFHHRLDSYSQQT
jgi:hypothetical protein